MIVGSDSKCSSREIYPMRCFLRLQGAFEYVLFSVVKFFISEQNCVNVSEEVQFIFFLVYLIYSQKNDVNEPIIREFFCYYS